MTELYPSVHLARFSLVALIAIFAVAACGEDRNEAATPEPRASDVASPAPRLEPSPVEPSATIDAQRFPDVIAAKATRSSPSAVRFDVTVSSPYDTAERYADAWRVLGEDSTIYAVRELLHDHAGEQPFTRTLDSVEIPDGVTFVTVKARDLVNGWGGETVEVRVPARP